MKILKNAIQMKNVLIVFDDIIPDMLRNKQVIPVVTELFIRERKLNISPFLLSCFAVLKNIRLNSMHYFVMKIENKEELNKLHLIIHQILTLPTL